jgi:hypothetical protein
MHRILTALNLGFLDRSLYSSFIQLLSYSYEAEWMPFRTHYYLQNMVAPGIEPGISGLVASNSEHWTTETGIVILSFALNPAVNN